jgi:hypothetical protein
MSLVEQRKGVLAYQLAIVLQNDCQLSASAVFVESQEDRGALGCTAAHLVEHNGLSLLPHLSDQPQHLSRQTQLWSIVHNNDLIVAVALLEETPDGIVVIACVESVWREQHHCTKRILLRG